MIDGCLREEAPLEYPYVSALVTINFTKTSSMFACAERFTVFHPSAAQVETEPMSTLSNAFPPFLQRFTQQVTKRWRSFFFPGDVFTLLLSFGLLLTPILGLQAAGWPISIETLLGVCIIGLLLCFFLARSDYGDFFALLISMMYGAGVVLIMSALSIMQGNDIMGATFEVFSRTIEWITDALTGGINQDDLVFTVFISALYWLMTYNLVWHIFRIDRLWRAVLPLALMLIINQIYTPSENNLDIYLIVFLFLTLLLTVRSNVEAREYDWFRRGIRVPKQLRTQFLFFGLLLTIATVLIGFLPPINNIQERLDRFQEFMSSDPLQEVTEFWNRLFSPLDFEGATTADYYGSDSLDLGGAIRLGDQVVFVVDAPFGRQYYWRSRTFDHYNMGRWTSAADTRLTDPESPFEVNYEPFALNARVEVPQTFTMGLGASRLIYTAPQPLQIFLPTRTDLSYTPDQSMNISVIRPMRVITEGQTYEVISLMSDATAEQLRNAGENYPQWVHDLYRQPIPSATPRTVALANMIVSEANAITPYDQARAIERWLRQNITYNELIPPPPSGQDPVDWVLFDHREGYCNYYASAMVVMLRALGIPARMAAGFAEGEFDPQENAYVVRERDAHTWVEVYFPGYGWIEFEPTASHNADNRGDETLPDMQPQVPTQTPTPTPTPEPTSTPEPQGEATEVAQEAGVPPSITPTFAPTLTATPVIMPTQPPPTRPTPNEPFGFITNAIGTALLLVFLTIIFLMVLLLIYWWWEWRGMRGLSPVSRAYARLMRYLGLVGIRFNPENTPDERRAKIVEDLPAAEPPVNAITSLYTRERYGRRTIEEKQENVANRAWVDSRSTILKRWLQRIFMPWKKH